MLPYNKLITFYFALTLSNYIMYINIFLKPYYICKNIKTYLKNLLPAEIYTEDSNRQESRREF